MKKIIESINTIAMRGGNSIIEIFLKVKLQDTHETQVEALKAISDAKEWSWVMNNSFVSNTTSTTKFSVNVQSSTSDSTDEVVKIINDLQKKGWNFDGFYKSIPAEDLESDEEDVISSVERR